MTKRTILGGLAALICGSAIACGGGSTPTSPGPGDGGNPGGVGATVTITPSGVNPASVSINAGQSVMLVNNDSRSHEISSNPHPAHTDCPQLNFGTLGPGQSRTSNAFPTARSCGYHDHNDPNNALWQGTLTIR